MILLLMLLLSGSPIPEARDYNQKGNYEDSLKVLEKYKPTPEEENDYNFLKATSHFALNQKKEAKEWLQKMEDSFNPLPRRYEALMYMMKQDLENWKDGDLGDIERDMKISGNRLQNHKGGEQTQKVQKDIVTKLDKLIKEQEDKANASQNAQNAPGSEKFPQGGNPIVPAKDTVMGGPSGQGKVDEKKLREVAEQWGTLPPARRAAIVQELTRELPPKYRPMIEEYFKALNRMDRK